MYSVWSVLFQAQIKNILQFRFWKAGILVPFRLKFLTRLWLFRLFDKKLVTKTAYACMHELFVFVNNPCIAENSACNFKILNEIVCLVVD